MKKLLSLLLAGYALFGTAHADCRVTGGNDYPPYGVTRITDIFSHSVNRIAGVDSALPGGGGRLQEYYAPDYFLYDLVCQPDASGWRGAIGAAAAADMLTMQASMTAAQADIASHTSAIAGKAAASHTHAQSDVTGLVTALAGKQATLSAGTGISIAGSTISSTVSVPTAQYWRDTTQKSALKVITKSGTTSGGAVTFNLTDTGLSGGNALCTSLTVQDLQLSTYSTGSTFRFGLPSITSGKTVTVSMVTQGVANIVSGVIGTSSTADGTPVNLTAVCD